MTSALAFDALRDVVERLPDDRLTPTRLAALEQLQRQGTPTTRDEDWKYTDLGSVIDISNQWLVDGAGSSANDSISARIADVTNRFDAHWIVIANGAVDLSSLGTAQEAGIDVALLSDTDSVPAFDAPLADLNVALLHDGLRILIGSGARLPKPIGILLIDSAETSVGVSQARIEIEIEAQGEAEVLEYHASSGSSSHYANSVINLGLGDNASVNYVRIQDRDIAHSQTARLSARLGRDSRLKHCGFDFGGRLVRNDLNIQLSGAGSSAAFHGLYLAGDGQHIDNHTRVDHSVGPATSNQEYRGILTGSSRCIWNGKAIVHAGADGTDAQQANHNLLLSRKAEVDAKPELEIYADEVKCAHGTTIGQLDETAMFYLRTRGLNRREAKQILTRAFAQSIVSMSPIEAFREIISEDIASRLSAMTHGEEK